MARPCRNGSPPYDDLRDHDLQLRAADILNLARQAERLGFEGLWFGEHYVSPRTYAGHHPSRKETPADKNDARDKEIIGDAVRIYDPWFLLGAVAGGDRRG
jgi:alkanesulfonate monooxygenase SsuD/methylene tetrahydromethanopterin reductase-like flavin-dependent oxidoreductase (luciferase family)